MGLEGRRGSRVFLTGFMGAGKSTAGRALAARLGVPLVDLDAEVERAAGSTVAEIFERHGEARFRALESAALARCGELEACVVATGGGAPIDSRNRAWMAEHGQVIWLDLPFAALRGRLAGAADRPLGRDPRQAEKLFRERLPAYRECDLRIAADGRTVDEIADEIAAHLARER
ncbi:MAG: shikimate kinase [Acidobacteriota bacterium]|nr:shikimate kinase [Acidobacteriota bacterium]MDH3523640.1 shikimate kinase [Acidobacteriota bacterium]